MDRLIPVDSEESIPPEYRGTPIGQLLEYHNLNRPFDPYDNAQLLVGMCMDNTAPRKISQDPDRSPVLPG